MNNETLLEKLNELSPEMRESAENYIDFLLYKARTELQKPVKKKKRVFGKFEGKAKAVFAEDWEMTEEELCNL